MKKLFTTEAVLMGHPDKMADLIADSILDAYLAIDKKSRCACEVAISKNKVLIVGEVTSKGVVDIEKVVRKTITNIGYDRDDLLFNGKTVQIIEDLNKQSLDIALGLNKKEMGAGDQGIMEGYATDETENYMPLVHNLSCALARMLDEVRKGKLIKGLRPDGKVQVTVEENQGKKWVKTIVVSCQHEDNIDLKTLKEEIILKVIKKVIPKEMINSSTEILINPTGRFVIGGPAADSGLTGRKISVDTYGGLVVHGGGAFSGKDCTKVDRSAAYYARYVAKNIVASKLASKCLVSVAYAIGVAKPLMVQIDTMGTNNIPEDKILEIVNKVFDFRPQNIIKELDLENVKYTDTTLYSHMGKDNLPWEKTKKVKTIKNIIIKNSL